MQNKGQAPKLSVNEMLADIKRKDELKRVNAKIGSGKQFGEDAPFSPSKEPGSETLLQQTTNLMDEAERQILQDEHPSRDSNLLNSFNILAAAASPGQRELDSDEMNEELMDEHAEDHNLVQPGWKISDEPSQADSAASTEQNS